MSTQTAFVVSEIAGERERQKSEEGWTTEHDDEHDDGQMALAAACYASPLPLFAHSRGEADMAFCDPWPWTVQNRGEPIRHFTSSVTDGQNRRRQLVIAAALIVAEIERIDRSPTDRDAP